MSPCSSGEQEKRGHQRTVSPAPDDPNARSAVPVQDEPSRHATVPNHTNEAKAMVRSHSGDHPQRMLHRIPELMTLRRSFSGCQDAKRSDAHTSNTVYTNSEGFRILTIKGTSDSIEKATSRVLYLLLESNPTKDFLRAAGAALRSLSFSAANLRCDIGNHTISVNFVVPGGTQLEDLKSLLLARMEKDGFDAHGLLLEKSTWKCELRGVPAGLFLVRGHGKAVVKLLAYAVRLFFDM